MPSVSELISQILLKKLRQEELSPEEVAMLAEWQGRSTEHAAFIDMLMDEAVLSDKIRAMLEKDQSPAWQKIENALEAEWNERSPGLRKAHRYKYLVAASVVLLLGVGAYYFLTRNPPVSQLTEATEPSTIADIFPGGNRAELILTDGSVINLSKTANGTVMQQEGARIVKQDGILSYTNGTVNRQQPGSNTIRTPRGGQFRLELSDGTIVWLNAASSIKFPTSFNDTERRIELTGEAYFEVAKAPKNFTVVVNAANGRKKAEVEVLGTRFNIMAYDDENVLKATLVQGKVKIVSNNAAAKSLKPGQQAIISGDAGNIEIKKVDTASSIAWKNGMFRFKNADLKTIMNQVSRWYNVEVVYQGAIPVLDITGGFERSYSIEQVREVLETYNVHLIIGKEKITVIP
jgi:ferric-dicitrate binding protein FerR (iron transport regulator)